MEGARRLGLGCALLAIGVVGLAPRPATATILYFSNPNVGGFVADSATPAFLAALGSSEREHLNFSRDASGNRILPGVDDDGWVQGDAFSSRLVLSSPDAPHPRWTERVAVVQATTNFWEIGPAPGYRGTLELDFIAGQGPLTAVGLGTVGFRSTSTLKVYDPAASLLGIFPGASDEMFGFVGLVARDGQSIGRVVLEGNGAFYALQDLTMAPEPGTGALLALGLAGLSIFRHRNRGQPL